MENTDAKPNPTTMQPPSTKHTSRYFIVGIILSVFNYGLYLLIVRYIFGNDLLWLATLISTTATTILAFILHSRITWKDRHANTNNIIRFFIWNAATAIAINPIFTWLFGLMTPIYNLAFNISSSLNLPFDYDFIQSTGAFCFTAVITMILNYLFYDKFVFNNHSKPTK